MIKKENSVIKDSGSSSVVVTGMGRINVISMSKIKKIRAII